MRERLIGDWLAKANERSFQVPFCWWLMSQGYQVLHLTRHSAMELGKDIIAIAPDGRPHVYQLKGTETRITMSTWRNELQKQLLDAVYMRVVHPSIPVDAPHHQAMLVTNGSLDEEVIRALTDFNDQRIKDGQPEKTIKTITGMEMEAGFKKMGEGFWPTDLVDTKTYLELYLANGKGRVPKEKLATLLDSTLDAARRGERAAEQAFAGAALVCAAATTSFTKQSNWAAEFESWTLLLAAIIGTAEAQTLAEKVWRPWAEYATSIMFDRLALIVDEIRARGGLIEGNPLVAKLTLPAKTIEVAGLVALYALWASVRGGEVDDRQVFAAEWLRRTIPGLMLPGEWAAPHFFAASTWFRLNDGTPAPDHLLLRAIDTILARNTKGKAPGLMNPYYDADTVMMAESGNEKVDETFKGASYSLAGFIYVVARRLWKENLMERWAEITHVDAREFVPPSSSAWLRWRNQEGEQVSKPWGRPHQWADLLVEARSDVVTRLPQRLLLNPLWYLAFAMVYPHRFTSDAVRWLDTALGDVYA